MITSSKIIFKALDFINARNTGNIGEYKMWEDGEVTLYSSCFAVMLYHYFGALPKFSKSQLKQWAEYINSWQDRETGYFIGPEIRSDELINKKHNYEHVLMHLSAHVLPALDILGVSPKYPLKFAHKFLVANNLTKWLENRDWNDAWLEGNNLLFIGQFLVYLRDQEKKNKASQSLKFYFDWLNSQLDPATGLWGTNGYCSNFVAMCGGYHQLLVYYYENRNILYKKNLIDTVLSLQHKDGGFSPAGGGGACEDVDACDILVNLYKQIDYRRSEIRVALRKLLKAVITKQMLDGGFVYKKDVSFIHMGVGKTKSPANVSNMFATWFRIHTIALIDEILGDKKKSLVNWNFNNVCSMGWHRKWKEQLNFSNYCMDLIVTPFKKVVINFLLFPKKILAKIY
ncbi:hypothetical protein J7L67_05145, partial [bacterium]|nr:hypothetical protein [bacterium]